MGMYVSQLRSVPIGRYEYYAYLVDSSAGGAHSKEVDRFFNAFAKQSSVDAVIVSGPQDLTDQLYRFLRNHAPADFDRMEALFLKATCLIVSDGALQTTTEPVHVLPLMLGGAPPREDAPLVDKLLECLLAAMREHRLTEFMQSLGAERVTLTEIKGGMFVATLRSLNDVLELKPNLAGLGLNLNAVIQQALGPKQRPLPE